MPPEFNVNDTDQLESLALAAKIAQDKTESAQRAGASESLLAMARELTALEARIDRGDALLKELKQRREALRKVEIPDEMTRLGMVSPDGKGSFSLDTGERFTIRNETFAGYAAADRPGVLSWLRDTGAGDLIKEEVHSSTLRAHCKELLADGRELPSFITVYREQAITVTRPHRGTKP